MNWGRLGQNESHILHSWRPMTGRLKTEGPRRAGLGSFASVNRVKTMDSGCSLGGGSDVPLICVEPDAVSGQTGYTAEGHGFGIPLRMILILKPDAFPGIGGKTAGRPAPQIIRLAHGVILKPDTLIGAVGRGGNGQQQHQTNCENYVFNCLGCLFHIGILSRKGGRRIVSR